MVWVFHEIFSLRFFGEHLKETIYFNFFMHFSITTMQLFFRTLPGKTITLEAEASDTIYKLKESVYNKEGIDPQKQRWVFAGKELQNHQTVAECKLCDQATLALVMKSPPFQLFVKTIDAKYITLEVDEFDTIGTVRQKIQDKGGIPPDRQRLSYQENILDDTKTLSYYQIQPETVLQLVLPAHE
jgi:ubiquitin C